jgi:hypothetical protein
MTFTCRAVYLGCRWVCTSEDGTKTWVAGPDYLYQGKLARDPEAPPAIETEPPLPLPPPTSPLLPKPAEGFEKAGGWGANKDPDTWTITRMKDDPTKFKVIDDKGKNVATHFTSKETAQYYIDYYQQIEGEGEEEEPNGPGEKPDVEPPTEPEPPSQEHTTVAGPYPSTGKELQSTQRGPTTRNYASGAPSDETVEKNVKSIKDRNHQFITYVTMKKIEHDDTMSQKIGGTHMGTGWFVNSVEFESGLCGIGVEKKHPSTSHNDVKGGKIGSILNKKIGMASVYFADQNKIELWTDTGDGKWVKQCEGVDVKGFNPKASTFECQLRIDGFEKGSVPTMHTAVVQPIAASSSTAAK